MHGEYFVYILFSPTFNSTYVGQTQDVGSRLDRHNRGMVQSTRRYLPWVLVHVETFPSRSAAMKREQWYKSGAGRRTIDQLLRGKGLR